MSKDLISTLKKKMTSIQVSHEKVVELQQSLGGEIFVPQSDDQRQRKTKSSSIACNAQQLDLYMFEALNELSKDEAPIKKKADIHTLGLVLLSKLIQQLRDFHEPITIQKIIEYVLLYKYVKAPSQDFDLEADMKKAFDFMGRLKGETKKTINYYDAARVSRDEIRIEFLRTGQEKVSISDIVILSLYVFQEIYEQLRQFYPYAVVDYSTLEQYVQRIPQGYKVFKNEVAE
jgi:hypothetical protein